MRGEKERRKRSASKTLKAIALSQILLEEMRI